MSREPQQHARAEHSATRSPAMRNVLLILLAGAAGAVDAISYVALGHVFTAAMTGNTVLLGLAIGQIDPQAVYFSGAALIGFLVGAAAGTWIVGPRHQNDRWSSRMTVAVMVEAAILGGVLICWSVVGEPLPKTFWQPILIAATAMAMGVQSAAVHHLSLAGISTTYITGTITSVVARLVAGSASGGHGNQIDHDSSWLLFAVWLIYLCSAASAAVLTGWVKHRAMLVPIALVLLTITGALASYGFHAGTPDAVE
jgi:uncharacterized membrane protein YoaK (UPF0700 family)